MTATVESSAGGREAGESARDSGRERDQQTLQDEARLAALVREEVERRFQSAKDKRWTQLEKQYRELSELRAQIGTPEEGDAPAEEGGRDQGEDLAARVVALARLPGLRANEEATARLLRHKVDGGTDGYLALLEELLALVLGDAPGQGAVVSSANAPANVSAASAVTPGGSAAPADLVQAYQRRKAMLRPGDVNALTALKREFRQKGLDVF